MVYNVLNFQLELIGIQLTDEHEQNKNEHLNLSPKVEKATD
jgi:hypothetical protein